MFAPSLYEPAPPAVPSKTASQRRDWIHLTEKYVLTNFEADLIGNCNLRYKNKTYAEHCHHLAPDWDTHKFCPDCYKRFGLPKCGKNSGLKCKFCDMNSDSTDKALKSDWQPLRTLGRRPTVNSPRTATLNKIAMRTPNVTATRSFRILHGSPKTKRMVTVFRPVYFQMRHRPSERGPRSKFSGQKCFAILNR